LLTCESVLSEALFLLRGDYRSQEAILGLINSQTITLAFSLSDEFQQVAELLQQYQSVPMSLADACLVRMAEKYIGSTVLTFDSDFTIYRKNPNQPIPVLMPTPER
jgi:predicted nucleic acid-binding protein